MKYEQPAGGMVPPASLIHRGDDMTGAEELAAVARGVTSHGLPLRKLTGVSEACMNQVYDMLRELSLETLALMYTEADPYETDGILLRHQIAFTVERKAEGRW